MLSREDDVIMTYVGTSRDVMSREDDVFMMMMNVEYALHLSKQGVYSTTYSLTYVLLST